LRAIAGHIVEIGRARTRESERRDRGAKKGREGKKKADIRFIRTRDCEERAAARQGRDPLSYGHIRDFFRLYLLASVRGKGQSLLY
jgi:hypothetical protein